MKGLKEADRQFYIQFVLDSSTKHMSKKIDIFLQKKQKGLER